MTNTPHRWNAIRRLAITLTAFAGLAGCATLAAQQKETENARAASYQMPPGEVYSETYALLSAAYPIAKESERRGFIETDWKKDTDFDGNPTRTKVSAEVLGEDRIRVVLRATVESQRNGTWTADTDSAGDVEDELYVTLDKRLRQRSSPPTATK